MAKSAANGTREPESPPRTDNACDAWGNYLFHHARPLEACSFARVYQQPDTDAHYEGAYRWLECTVGFYPLFLAVGRTEDDVRMTGYQNQWRRIIRWSREGNTYRDKGTFPNVALFSFPSLPNGVFMDYNNWHLVLNSSNKNYRITEREQRMIFRPSWRASDWLRYGKRHPHGVQLVVPHLDLPQAGLVCVRNQSTKRNIERMGFAHVIVRKLAVDAWP